MKPQLRVHISAVGFDVDRVVQPLIRMKADKVYLITKEEEDLGKLFLEKVTSILTRHKIEYEIVYCDIFNLVQCIQKISEIIHKEKDNQVYVNLSTGTNIISIAGMLASMTWSARPYYVEPEKYINPGQPLSVGVKEIVEVPAVFTITKPKEEWLHILKFLSKQGPIKKKILIKYLREKELIRKPEKIKGSERQSAYRHLDTMLVDIRDRWGLVAEEGQARAKRIRITEKGEIILKMFEFLIIEKKIGRLMVND